MSFFPIKLGDIFRKIFQE